MFTNSLGQKVDQEEPIFPLISFNSATKIFKCVGTGFFIQPLGGFVTARHVFFDNNGQNLPTLYAIQTTSNQERHVRVLRHIVTHPDADIAIGFLGQRRLAGKNIKPEIASPFTLSFDTLNAGDKIRTYAFPLTETQNLDNGKIEFTFSGKWSTGEVVDFHEEGSPLVHNKCYQTTMKIDHGASGGPVLKNDLVVGINSSGMDLFENDVPLSYITPINYILDLFVPSGDEIISVKELIDGGSISAK
ncbi:MAG TPA: trypsin-like peptidase domain-containing protein [Hanamia sp.]